MTSQISPIPVPGSRGKRSLFARVSDWPLINDLLAARSESLMAGDGITVWQSRGGRIGSDGRFGFGEFSAAARDVLREVADRYPGFRWRDGNGTSWAIRLTGNESDSHFVAHAVSFNRGVGLLDSRDATRLRNACRSRLVESEQRAGPRTAGQREHHERLLRCARNIELIDAAGRWLLFLGQAEQRTGTGELVVHADELATAFWGSDKSGWPDELPTEVGAFLRAAMGFQVAVVHLGRFGWAPDIVSQSAAISHVELQGADAFRVRVSRLLLDVFTTFTSPSRSKPRGRLNEPLPTAGVGVILLGG